MEALPIAEKYELETVPFALGGKKLDLYQVKNWDRFIDALADKGEEYISQFPFWIKVWEASIVLADHLLRMEIEKGKEILEIGAGMGVAGLCLGALGHKVTITDYEDDALELLRMNVEHNGLDNVSVRKLDWNSPDLTGKYDIICGSELVYNETFIHPIMDLLRNYITPDGIILLAHDIKRMCMMKFIGMVTGRFEIENVVKTLRGDGEVHKILIHTLRIKQDGQNTKIQDIVIPAKEVLQ